MIHWLVQSLTDHPDLGRGEAPPGLLGRAESARLAELRVAKRRRDWLLGRWTAKHLLQSVVERQMGLRVPLNAFVIENDVTGAPFAVIDSSRLAVEYPSMGAGQQPAGSAPPVAAVAAAAAQVVDSSVLQSLSLSISHSDGQAFCAVAMLPGSQVGADIERIEPRAEQFAEEYLTAEETARLHKSPAGLSDTFLTVTWSAKEAVLKALRLGLTVDTRRVACLIDPPADKMDPVLFGYRWSRFSVNLSPDLLRAAGATAEGRPPVVAGWWQIMSNYALTLVLLSRGNGLG